MSENVFSDRINAMKSSSTMKAALAAAKLREAGVDVIDLTVGEPDFPTPEFIVEYAIEGMRNGLTKYTPVSGITRFKDAVQRYYQLNFGSDIQTDEIAPACGGKQALFNAIATLINPGDEVLIPKPFWVSFPEMVNFCQGTNVYIDTEETDFVLTYQQVEKAITENTKLLILNSPSNPSGRVISTEEIKRIIDLCVERGIFVISDECYLQFVYPPGEVYSAASLPREYRDYVCIAGSFSKTYAMTGWRIGYSITNSAWTKQILKLQGHSATHPTSFVQYACARALEDSERSNKAVNEMLAEYKRRRDWFIPALQGINGIKCSMPQGAFYAFIDVREAFGAKFSSSAEFCEKLLEEQAVVATDGEGFGADGFVRLSYATSMKNLESAIKALHLFMD
ncbi:MAG: pyridoxal phosphate-dependent aminotransferase [Pyrinomonadaceae bacterium]